jgi:trans-aconitate 2-methyltransferase
MSEWDGGAYQRLSEPQLAWGSKVLDRLALRGDERALDAGCGAGRVTALLCARVQQVIGVDQSQSMLETARATLAGVRNVALVRASVDALPFDGAVDVIFSTATFHWVRDHERLFGSLARALRPGGRLEAQCGGAANVARLMARTRAILRRAPFAAHMEGFRDPWLFADAETTAARLRAAGFVEVETWLEEERPTFADAATYAAFLEKIVLRDHLVRLPVELRRALLDELAAAGDFSLDYVRLNLRGRRA